jgi:SAM-dependent methyltransferase
MTAPDHPNAAQTQYWNSALTRVWSNRHEPIDALFAPLTQVVLDAAAPQPGEHVLDIGCGSGTTVLALAARLGPQGHVLGVDISQGSVERARERIAAAGARNAKVILADVSTHAFTPKQFDLVFSRFGVMFFADPIATFARVRAAMKPGGRLTCAVFRAPERNPWQTAPPTAVRQLLPPVPPPAPDEPGQFAWADPARIHRILEGARFAEITLTPHDPDMRLGSTPEEATTFAMNLGPTTRGLIDATDAVRDAVRAGLLAFFQRQAGPNGVVLPGAIWIVKARA